MPYLMDDVATWVHSKWVVIRKAYIECIFTTKSETNILSFTLAEYRFFE